LSNEIFHRKNINSLEDSELRDLCKAFRKLMDLRNDDNRSFAKHAETHGYPDDDCWHGPKNVGGHAQVSLFLPWHRAYLYRLEKDLQDQVPGVTIPYWDWRTKKGEPETIPDAFSAQTINGEENPLRRFYLNYPNTQNGVGYTIRRIDQHPQVQDLPNPEQIKKILKLNTFEVFSNQLRMIHGSIHLWIGGDMSTTKFAAFDPIFWAHHSMVDKIWWDWQQGLVIENIPSFYKPMSLSPFEGIVEEYLDTFKLGYDYSEDSKEITGEWSDNHD